jgi:hypothetical protein
MDIVTALLSLLVLHAALGALDTIVSHEWREHLPAQPWASTELALHSLRSLFFVVIFFGLAWYEWHGVYGWLIVAIVLAEYGVTIIDSVVEDRTRRLSFLERTNHMLLALNTGVYASVLTLLVATEWQRAPTGLVRGHHPRLLVAALTFAALAVAGWVVRDGVASLRLRLQRHRLAVSELRSRPAAPTRHSPCRRTGRSRPRISGTARPAPNAPPD